MNNRQWKKACKKAAAELERKYPGDYEITPADGEEIVYAPRGYQPPPRLAHSRFSRTEYKYAQVPTGTPLIHFRASYEYGEWEAHTALEVLQERDFAEAFDWDAAAREVHFDDALDEACRAVFVAIATPVVVLDRPEKGALA